MANMLSCNIMNASANNAGASTSEVAYQSIMTEATEQWKTDAAGEGSIFTKTVFTTVSLLLFLFIALSPIVIMVGVAMGMAGFGLFAKHALFGAWTQSWLPIAAAINAYMLIDFNKRMSDFKSAMVTVDPSVVLTCKTLGPFYDAVSTSIATASTMLASSGTVALAIMTGSTFALAGLASRAGGSSGYVDEKRYTGSSSGSTNADALMKPMTDAAVNPYGGSYGSTASGGGTLNFGSASQSASTQGALGSVDLTTSGGIAGSSGFSGTLTSTAQNSLQRAVEASDTANQQVGQKIAEARRVSEATSGQSRESESAEMRSQGGSTSERSYANTRATLASAGVGVDGGFNLGKQFSAKAGYRADEVSSNARALKNTLVGSGDLSVAAANNPATQKVLEDLTAGKVSRDAAAGALSAIESNTKAGRSVSADQAYTSNAKIGASARADVRGQIGDDYSQRDGVSLSTSGASSKSTDASLSNSKDASKTRDYSTDASVMAAKGAALKALSNESSARTAAIAINAGASITSGTGGSGKTNLGRLHSLIEGGAGPGGPSAGVAVGGALASATAEANAAWQSNDGGQAHYYPPKQAAAAVSKLSTAAEGGTASFLTTAAGMVQNGSMTERGVASAAVSSLLRSSGNVEAARLWEGGSQQARGAALMGTQEGNEFGAAAANPNMAGAVDKSMQQVAGTLTKVTESSGQAISDAATNVSQSRSAVLGTTGRIASGMTSTEYASNAATIVSGHTSAATKVARAGNDNVTAAQAVNASAVASGGNLVSNAQTVEAANAMSDLTAGVAVPFDLINRAGRAATGGPTQQQVPAGPIVGPVTPGQGQATGSTLVEAAKQAIAPKPPSAPPSGEGAPGKPLPGSPKERVKL